MPLGWRLLLLELVAPCPTLNWTPLPAIRATYLRSKTSIFWILSKIFSLTWLVIRQIYVSVISYVTTTLLKQSIIVIFSSFQSFKGFPFLTKVHLFVLLFPNEGHPSLAKRPLHFSLSLVKVSYSANRRPLICFFFSSINIFLFNGRTYRFPPII